MEEQVNDLRKYVDSHRLTGVNKSRRWKCATGALILLLLSLIPASAEVVLQYFNTTWRELAEKLPELAEVGYGALWLPPPTKGSGALSVGYDLWDPFDLGGKDQRGTVRTRYGTEEELLRLIRTAHRFGMRVYVDNIMNHRAFDVPGFSAYTPIDVYPGMLPEDFHLRVTEEGFYRKWDNVANWGDTWQVQYRNFSDLIDIAQEMPDNGNFGANEGDHVPKIRFVRHPDNPEYYDDHPSLGRVGFGDTNITAQVIAANGWYYEEDVNSYLIRSVRWLVHHTKIDGLRLDAVKHVPAYFFGEQWAADKNSSNSGYCGQAQWQFNHTRGFIDWDNHRDTVFDTEASFGRNDLMMFGEHLGAPPPFGDYIAAGMRLVDSQLHGYLNGNLGQPWGSLADLDWPGAHGFAAGIGVPYVKSHDDDYATRPGLQYAFILTRLGLPNVYTDGNYQSETLGESGGAFPRHANTAFLGQFRDNRIPNLVYIHNHFARGPERYDGGGYPTEGQIPRWSDGNVVAFERRDKRENSGMDDADGTVLFFVMNDNYSGGEYREMSTSFRPGDYLWQYSTGGGNFYYEVPWDRKIKVIVPPGGYFAFSWRSPEASDTWSGGGGDVYPITIHENGQPSGWVSYERKDGHDGDPAFNPYGVYDEDRTDFSYTYYVPRVHSSSNLDFVVRVDGSAENVMLKLDGGMNLNATNHPGGDPRDHPPGNEGSTEVYEGYEQIGFQQRLREKFAARFTARNIIGSVDAESYQFTCGGTNGFSYGNGSGDDSDVDTVEWVFHNPELDNGLGQDQFWPAPSNAANADIYIWAETGYRLEADRVYLYYTTDGATWPEGSGGMGVGNTQVIPMNWTTNAPHNGVGIPDWWVGVLPAQSDGTVVRYRIGAYHHDASSIFPGNADNVYWKKKMLTEFAVRGFNAATVSYRPHNDFSEFGTGLEEGFHVLRARALLNREGRAAIYNTFVQPFYYDVSAPTGEIVYPAENDWIHQNEYGVVVRTDPTVTEAWFHIDDGNPANDDGQTGWLLGNGTNAAGEAAWAPAVEVSPSLNITSGYPSEWRFSYSNIPTNSPATILVKLAELSSSTNPLLSDVQGHYTTLTRHVTASGPSYDMFIAWPQNDGDIVSEGYGMKVWFSKILASGISTNVLRDRFTIDINGITQGKAPYDFNWDVSGDYHELVYPLPDLYNGDPQFMHQIQVTHTNAAGGGVTLVARRMVRASETDMGPHVDIVSPPEFDSDGKPFEIVLRDVPDPDPEDRQYTIRVETDLSVRHCWIEFTNSVGSAGPYPSVSNRLAGTVAVSNGVDILAGLEEALSGTVSVTSSNTLVAGVGTAFMNEVVPGYTIRIATNHVVVTQVVSHTEMRISSPYAGSSDTGLSGFVQPALASELSTGDSMMIDGNFIGVDSILSQSNLVLSAPYPGVSVDGVPAYRIDGNPQVSGNRQFWHFLWTNMTAGRFTFLAQADTNDVLSTVEGYAIRNVTVILREMVDPNPDDYDEDDDGIYDHSSIEWGETVPVDLPDTNPETWLSGDVHIWQIYGRTAPLLPDSDGDGLPDGLESGWRNPIDTNHTDVTVDTDGDGFPNFIADLDPPFYNTVPDNGCGQKPGPAYCLPEFLFTGSRTKPIHGSMTDPSRPDTDYDGLPDGVEDANRNGWADGDGKPLSPLTSDPWTERPFENDWPNAEWKASWQNHAGRETDPNKGDTDEDGAVDGYGEDRNFNGVIDGDLNSNRVHETGELWQESDPLNPDTDADGLPDGWEVRYVFDPLNDGVPGHTNMQTGGLLTTNDVEHGANGNPDGDSIVIGGLTNDYINIMEYQNGTNPRYFDSGDPPPAGSIVIGPGPIIGILDGVTNYQEFMDWRIEDCIVLDEYEGDGNNNQGGDVYKAWDGYDESQDIVAFYAHDGGDVGNNGDGKFYFRLDFHDLKAFAEEGKLDLYIVVDTGNPEQGEMTLPDDVDTITWNRWEAVIAVYESSVGRIFIDKMHDAGNNTTTWGQDVLDPQYGVIVRDQSDPQGFLGAYFNSELDAVEFAISRDALIEAGWGGAGASGLNYQVFTTRDGTGNNPVGPGDIGGRSDIRDAIYNDYISEDYWQAQEGLESILKYWIPGSKRAGRSKVSLIIHGNRAIEPGSVIQGFVNTGAGAGYYRPLDVHALFSQPLNLHVTPTLASAIEWARVDPAISKPWLDGPSLNRKIEELVRTNVVDLMGSSFSDHMLPYFRTEFNQDNEELAREFLSTAYGFEPTAATVFWTPERLLDTDVFNKILDMGYGHTVLDQDTHIFNWYGRQESLIEGGYRINDIQGVKCFVINHIATSYRFSSQDHGVDVAWRALFNRKARSGIQDQVITVLSDWGDFADKENADNYDWNVRWIANRPWVAMVTLEQIAAGDVAVWDNAGGDQWFAIDRPAPAGKQSHNWLNHATDGNYDYWYEGSSIEESLLGRVFEVRPGTDMPKRYGMHYTDGIVLDTWNSLLSIGDGDIARLARAALHASVLQTAWHDETDNDLRRYSTGEYMYPAGSSNALSPFAVDAQSRTRSAAVYEHIDDWAWRAGNGWYDASSVATNLDVDLDGEDEYLLFNDRLCLLFERIGGRMIASWVRDLMTHAVFQTTGSLAGDAGRETEQEGTYNVEEGGEVVAHRTSCLKDWWVSPTNYVNQLYSFVPVVNGWQITSSDTKIKKTVTLAPGSNTVEVTYVPTGDLWGKTIYIRNGLAPHAYDLLLRGQGTLGDERLQDGKLWLVNTNYESTIAVWIGYGDAGHNVTVNAAAVDDDPDKDVEFSTINMRNQAQTHQVEISGVGPSFSFSFGFSAGSSDWDGDGMPNIYEDDHVFLDPGDASDGTNDFDSDGSPNSSEFTAGTDPNDDTDYLHVTEMVSSVTGIVLHFPAKPVREYGVWYDNHSLIEPVWSNATPVRITVPGETIYEWEDDGTHTWPSPADLTNRFYQIRVRLPVW